MHSRITVLLSLFNLIFIIGCTNTRNESTENSLSVPVAFEQEKAFIRAVLNSETKAAFTRDYESWKSKWVHQPYVTKTYINFAENTMTETLGWDEINQFVKTYIEEHPDPAPLPDLVDDIDIRLYGNAAWVSYEQNDAERGRKRETRLMEKIDGTWKIAGMHTTIYGFTKE